MTDKLNERISKASMEYGMAYLKYCNILRETLLNTNYLEVRSTNIMNSPFYLTESAIEATMVKLKDFVSSFGYTCEIKDIDKKRSFVFSRLK